MAHSLSSVPSHYIIKRKSSSKDIECAANGAVHTPSTCSFYKSQVLLRVILTVINDISDISNAQHAGTIAVAPPHLPSILLSDPPMHG